MAVYVIVGIHAVHDPQKLQQYRDGFDKLLDTYGGRRVVGTDRVITLEGDWKPARMAMYVFENMTLEQLQAAYSTPEYQPLLKLRQEAIDSEVIVVEGL